MHTTPKLLYGTLDRLIKICTKLCSQKQSKPGQPTDTQTKSFLKNKRYRSIGTQTRSRIFLIGEPVASNPVNLHNANTNETDKFEIHNHKYETDTGELPDSTNDNRIIISIVRTTNSYEYLNTGR